MVDEPKVKVKVYLEDFLAKFQLVANKVTSWSGTASDDKYPSAKLVKDSLDGKSSSTHTHGNLSNDGKVGTNSGYFITTTTGGAITSQQKAGNITTDGKVGTSANKPLITTTNGVVTTGSFGTSANSFCEGNDSRLSDARTPLAHTHDLDDITDYMVTSISCSDYNPTIDSTVTVTVFVGDSEGVGIQGVSVPVTASVGNFTKLNGVTITASSSVTGITGANGTFTLTYSCTEWGLITFSANNSFKQITIQGWREVTLPSSVTSYCDLYVNEATRECDFKYYRTDYNFTKTSSITLHTGLIPEAYRPLVNVICASFNEIIVAGVITDGSLSVASSATGSKNINISAMWHY